MDTKRTLQLLLFLSMATAGAAADRDLRLVEAAKHADESAVRALLTQGIDVNQRAGDGATALYWAAYRDNKAIADLLLRSGATVDAVNDLGVTPLWMAARNASAAMIATLLDAHANPNLAPEAGGTPLMVAARRGHVEGAVLLLAHGADANAAEREHGQTALMWAAAEHHPDVVRVLLAAGADLRARTRIVRRHVMLCCEAYEGDPEGAADIDEGGFTPLLFAAQQGDIESARLLLDAGADVNDAAPMGTSALVVAVHGGHGAFAAFLLERGANANDNRAGYTALHLAAVRGDLPLIEALLAHGADVNARQLKASPTNRVKSNHALDKTMIGATPFLLATRVVELDTMRLLTRHGADVTLTLNDGTTPVMAVALPTTNQALRMPEARVAEAMKLAIALGAKVDGANRDGVTALHIAATRRLDSVVQLLADSGAPLNAKNKNGETPLALALKPPPPVHGAGQTIVTAREALVNHTATAELLRRLGATE